MPRFSLRTLIVVMLLGGPALAAAYGWWVYGRPHSYHIWEEVVGAMIAGGVAAGLTAAFVTAIPRPRPILRLASLVVTVFCGAILGGSLMPAITSSYEEAAWNLVESVLASAAAAAAGWGFIIRTYKPEVAKPRQFPKTLGDFPSK